MKPLWPKITWESSHKGCGPRILGINPWVEDFAAYGLWSRPAGLLALLDMLRSCGAQVALMDAMDQTWADAPWPRPKADGTSHYPKTPIPKPPLFQHIPRRFCRYGHGPERIHEALRQLTPPPDLVLVTSIMTYWYPSTVETVRMVRRLWPRTPIAVGGVYPTLCPHHAQRLEADLLIRGPAEDPANWSALWGLLGESAPPLPLSPGFALAQDILHEPRFGVLLGSRGCPFACPYCASAVLSPGFRQAPLKTVRQQLHRLLDHGLRHIAFYDDALLLRPETWLWDILDEGRRHGVTFHTPNAVHVRALSPATCRRLWQGGVRSLRLGLETLDFARRLDAKLSLEEWQCAAAALRQAGFRAEHVRAYVLFGLPQQDDAALEATIQEAGRLGIPVELAFYSPIPGTPLFALAQKASPWPLEDEPLTQNNSLWPCRPGGFSWEEATRWKALVRQAQRHARNHYPPHP